MNGRYAKDIRKEEKILRIKRIILEEIKKEKLDFFALLEKVRDILQYEFKEGIDENEFGKALGILQGEKLVDSEIDIEDIRKKPPWRLTIKGIKFMQ